MGFKKLSNEFPGIVILQPDVLGDERGYFLELYNKRAFEALGIGHLEFVQDNMSYSTRGTLRGMHFQYPPYAQGKLVTVFEGEALDVAVDLRKTSPTYGKVFSYKLKAEEHTALYIPEGFAHGFQVLSEVCMFHYKCTGFYHKDAEGGLKWDDPELAIPWEDVPPILSPKDRQLPLWEAFDSPFQEYENIPASDSMMS